MIQGFNNVNNAACTLAMIRPQILGLVCQFAFYSITAFMMDISERNHYHSKVHERLEEFREFMNPVPTGCQDVTKNSPN